MTISDAQHEQLLRPPSQNAVHTRSQAGKTFTYMAQQAVRAELIRVFGFDGWEGQVLDTELIESKQVDEKKWMAVWRVRYRLTVRWESEYPSVSTWVEDAVASAFGNSQPDTLDQALKSAASDAMKRCAMNLGSRFGLSLYFDGKIADVVRYTPQAPLPAPALSAPSEGDTTHSHESGPPEAAQRPDLNTPEGVAEEIERLKADSQGDAPEWTLA